MTPAELLLVRHGETDWNRERRVQGQTDIPLNDRGRAQARLLAQRLARRDVHAIVSSDLARAAETARIVGDALGLEPRLAAEWRELHLGEAEGEDAVEATRQRGELISAVARAGRPLAPGGESFAEFDARIEAGFDAICREHAGRTIVIVSHGGTLKGLIARLIGLAPVHIDRLSLRSNSSLSVVDFRHGRAQLTLLNDASHLG